MPREWIDVEEERKKRWKKQEVDKDTQLYRLDDAIMIERMRLLARSSIYGGIGSLAFLLEVADRLEELTKETK